MRRLSSLIRFDKEFSSSVELMRTQLQAANPKPIIINGLTSGASSAYLAEAIAELKKFSTAPAIIIVGSESEREKCAMSLCNSGLAALEYKARDFVFHNISPFFKSP